MNSEELLAKDYQSKDIETYFQQERSEMLQYVTLKAGRILEVGCASGLFGQLLKTERSVEVWGVELNDSAAEMAAQRLDRVNLLNWLFLKNIEDMRYFQFAVVAQPTTPSE